MRESTPSTAAARAVPDSGELLSLINGYYYSLSVLLNQKTDLLKSKLEYKILSLENLAPLGKFNEYSQSVDYMIQRLKSAMDKVTSDKRTKLMLSQKSLSGLYPLAPLEKGYMIATDENDNIINTVQKIKELKKAKLKAKDGTIDIYTKD